MRNLRIGPACGAAQGKVHGCTKDVNCTAKITTNEGDAEIKSGTSIQVSKITDNSADITYGSDSTTVHEDGSGRRSDRSRSSSTTPAAPATAPP
jgi:hypothetical protein